LKTADFRLLTRTCSLAAPTQLADELYRTAAPLVDAEANGRRFRLLGVGAGKLGPESDADPPDLLDPGKSRRVGVERAMDRLRTKFGRDAIAKGRGWTR
jgi:DNA polymerase-4